MIVCGTLLAVPDLRPANLDAAQIVVLAFAILAAAFLYLGFSVSLGLRLFRQQAMLQPLHVWLYAAALGLAWWQWGLTVTSAAVIWTCGQLLGGIVFVTLALRQTHAARPSIAVFRRTLAYGVRA